MRPARSGAARLPLSNAVPKDVRSFTVCAAQDDSVASPALHRRHERDVFVRLKDVIPSDKFDARSDQDALVPIA